MNARRLEEADGSKRRGLEFFAPAILSLCLTLSAIALVAIELAQPPPSADFSGPALSNAVHSNGARTGLALFRDRLGWLPFSMTDRALAPNQYIWALRAALLAMAAVQIAAVLYVIRRRITSLKLFVAGAALASAVLLLYPPISTDVFSYASFGWEATHGHNPYLESPLTASGRLSDPFAKMNDWEHIATPYGPIWTGISRAVVAEGDEDPFVVALAFKAIAGLSGLALGFAAYRAVLRLTEDRPKAIAGFLLVSWSPILLFESAATAHNDALMASLALAGLLIATSPRRHALRVGLLVIAVAVLIKPVALPLLLLAALVRLWQPRRSFAQLARRWAFDLISIAAVVVLSFLPFWKGTGLVRAIWGEQRSLYVSKPLKVNPLWVWAAEHAGKILAGEHGLNIAVDHGTTISQRCAQLALLAALGLALIPLRNRIEIAQDWRRVALSGQVWAWSAATVGLGLLPVNAHAWYAIWPLAPLAVLGASSPRRSVQIAVGLVFLWTLLSFLVYHTWLTVTLT